ncbi:hypothetical protein NSP_47490 [Nodularia spumigena CCY9414]|nr:hypothetical protein NSP_47490 [Nodularia spumigena CCY9414]
MILNSIALPFYANCQKGLFFGNHDKFKPQVEENTDNIQ